MRERLKLGVTELREYQTAMRSLCERSSDKVLCKECNSFEVK